MEKAIIYTKNGGKWAEYQTITDPATLHEKLARDLRAKYIHKAGWITRITDRTNYDGTRTIAAYYDNGVKTVYIVRD